MANSSRVCGGDPMIVRDFEKELNSSRVCGGDPGWR